MISFVATKPNDLINLWQLPVLWIFPLNTAASSAATCEQSETPEEVRAPRTASENTCDRCFLFIIILFGFIVFNVYCHKTKVIECRVNISSNPGITEIRMFKEVSVRETSSSCVLCLCSASFCLLLTRSSSAAARWLLSSRVNNSTLTSSGNSTVWSQTKPVLDESWWSWLTGYII